MLDTISDKRFRVWDCSDVNVIKLLNYSHVIDFPYWCFYTCILCTCYNKKYLNMFLWVMILFLISYCIIIHSMYVTLQSQQHSIYFVASLSSIFDSIQQYKSYSCSFTRDVIFYSTSHPNIYLFHVLFLHLIFDNFISLSFCKVNQKHLECGGFIWFEIRDELEVLGSNPAEGEKTNLTINY